MAAPDVLLVCACAAPPLSTTAAPIATRRADRRIASATAASIANTVHPFEPVELQPPPPVSFAGSEPAQRCSTQPARHAESSVQALPST